MRIIKVYMDGDSSISAMAYNSEDPIESPPDEYFYATDEGDYEKFFSFVNKYSTKELVEFYFTWQY